ncbi:MAG TPA: type I DNA topoisomerase [Acidimicrobiales bacterium]|nr:type I DNA topoisomerase [Acidimicrobiales bacterium]
MPKPLVIVESPAKAKTIAGFLGPDYIVESSIGHIRDLPRNAADVPSAYKGEPWARLGVDVDNDFKPLYVVTPDKRDQVRKLKALLKEASELYLATDEDREGESIAWHLLEVLAPRVPVRRMVFHEITRPAIERAVRESRDLDRRLVDAQETRRILDRLYGYEVSPVLWKKVMRNLSAGRVQSPATRLLIDRERARMRFRSAQFWDVAGTFEVSPPAPAEKAGEFPASLAALGGRRLATGRDFGEDGTLTRDDVVRLDEGGARALADQLDGRPFTVRSVEERPWRRTPAPPFMTSTLQQEAGRKLRFSSARTMRVAQDLYEAGFITYMRTDSTTLSAEALAAARDQARSLYGPRYVPDQPRRYDKKVKNAQEAHEAIRPAGETFRTPEQTGLTGDHRRLYELVWMRTVASQMADATGRSVAVRLGAETADGTDAEFATSGRVITFPGFLRAYVEGSDDPDTELGDREVRLPALAAGDRLDVRSLEPEGHATSPPARYTEASLVKALEELGVGRPSTYATILETIQSRGYAWKKGTALVPSWTSFAVISLLEQHFGTLVDYGFTAAMEEELDEIARGDEESVPWLTRFYFGTVEPGLAAGGDGTAPGLGAQGGLKRLVHDQLGAIDAREINSITIGRSPDGEDIVLRVGRYGPYIQQGDRRASVPEDLAPDELTPEKAEELLSIGSSERVVGDDPETGLPIFVRAGRYGPYVQVGDADSVDGKPRTASLLSGMDPSSVTVDDALKVLSLPRTVGVDPATGEEIVAANGRYGPYVKKGSDSRSLESEQQLFDIGLDEALAIFAQPKLRRGQRAAPPLRELGADPVTGGTIVLKDGRFGPYVTDGTTNASLRKGDTPEALTPERAAELLADRRAAGPAKRAKKAPAKRTIAKKASAGSKASAGTKAAPAKKGAPAKRSATTKAAAKKATAAKAAGRAAPG